MAIKPTEMNILSYINNCHNQRHPLLAILIDPNKTDAYHQLLPYLQLADLIFVGGSTGDSIEPCIATLRQHTFAPLIISLEISHNFQPMLMRYYSSHFLMLPQLICSLHHISKSPSMS